MASAKTMDLTEGPILNKMLRFAIPIILGNLLQQLYTAADRVVVGQFAENGANALAAIGVTISPLNLLIGFFVGIATGNNVICANLLGAKNNTDLRKSMHTSILLGLICGVGICVLGILLAPLMLAMMGTPQDVMAQAVLYMRVFFLGVPASLLYNIGAGILRAHGDTKRPMYILMLSGLLNVLLNLVFVIIFHWSVAGVAAATALSHYVSAVAVLWIMFRPKDQYKITIREMRIDKRQMMAVIRIGVPSGLGSMVFSASNIVIQTAMNSLNSAAVIAGKAAATDINNMVYQIQAAFLATCVSFSGQCYGAKQYKRIDKVAITATLTCLSMMGVCSVICAVFAPQLVGLFNSDTEVVGYGSTMLRINTLGILVYVPAEIYLGCSRGMRHAMAPTMLNMVAVCGVRMLWVLLVFPLDPTVPTLYYCFPISWFVSSALQISYYLFVRRKQNKLEAKTA